jgi:hypothetical protein
VCCNGTCQATTALCPVSGGPTCCATGTTCCAKQNLSVPQGSVCCSGPCCSDSTGVTTICCGPGQFCCAVALIVNCCNPGQTCSIFGTCG